ncbi:MAG: nucleoside deaminase [Planctomycetaceae bacterium]|nr:nucleoside deaminase [Planctomycetaceae bacterium]
MHDATHTHTERQEAWMREAIRLSIKSVETGGGPFGAVVVHNGSVISRGQNRVTATNDPTAHAEIVAIRDACQQLETFSLAGCELLTSCEPCPMCFGAILWARLDRVWYANTRDDAAQIGFDDRTFYDEIARPLPMRHLPMHELLRSEAQAAFTAWQRLEGKTVY